MPMNLHKLSFRRAASACDCRWSRRLALLGAIVALGSIGLVSGQFGGKRTARLIGATAVVTEVSSGLPLAARVDTGAAISSIHCEAVEIEDAAEIPAENIGKPIRILVRNKAGTAEWIASKIVDRVLVRTSKHDDWRYVVRLGLRWGDVQKDVLVTLNNRVRMNFPILLGRNFLNDDVIVNVALAGPPELSVTAESSAGTTTDAPTGPGVSNGMTSAADVHASNTMLTPRTAAVSIQRLNN